MKKRIKVILLIFILLMLAAAGIFVFQNGGKISKTSKKPDGNGENRQRYPRSKKIRVLPERI